MVAASFAIGTGNVYSIRGMTLNGNKRESFSALIPYMVTEYTIHHAIFEAYGSRVHHSSLYSMIIGSSALVVWMQFCKG